MIQINVPMSDLRDGLRSVLPGTDKPATTTPILSAAHVKITPDGLILQTTDRRVAMEYTVPLGDGEAPDQEAGFTMRLEDAQAIVKAIPARGPAFTVALTALGGGDLVVDLGRWSSLTLAAVEGEFPPIERLFKENPDPKLEGPLGLGVRQLTQLTTATKHLAKDPGLIFTPGSTSTEPVMVSLQEPAPWRALIMPRRLNIPA